MDKVTLDEALEWVGEYSKPERFADIRRHLDPAWIERALEVTGTATLRKRRLPADQVVWLVIGMALYRDKPIHHLVDRLDLVLPGNELWGIFLAYNMVRLEMERTADQLGVEPVRISFVGALRLICEEWWWISSASPGAIPKNLARLRSRIAKLVLPPRRSERRYPRAVKIKMSNYVRKRPVARS